MQYQLFGKRIQEYKDFLFKEQNGKCKICENSLKQASEAHLDHDHQLLQGSAGKCRGLLCRACNIAEARMKNRFIREGLRDRVDYSKFLRNLADYYEQDFQDKPFHIKFISDYIKYFNKLNISEQIEQYKKFNFELPNGKLQKKLLSQDFQKKFKNYQKSL